MNKGRNERYVEGSMIPVEKEFEIQGRICNLPAEMTDEVFWHTMIGFIEGNGWSFGGGLEMEAISGCVFQTSPDMTREEFEEIFLGFIERNNWSFEGTITVYGKEIEGDHGENY